MLETEYPQEARLNNQLAHPTSSVKCEWAGSLVLWGLLGTPVGVGFIKGFCSAGPPFVNVSLIRCGERVLIVSHLRPSLPSCFQLYVSDTLLHYTVLEYTIKIMNKKYLIKINIKMINFFTPRFTIVFINQLRWGSSRINTRSSTLYFILFWNITHSFKTIQVFQ